MKAIPTAVKKLRGTIQPCRNVPELEVKNLSEPPEAPHSLNVDGGILWDRMSGTLVRNRVLAVEDLAALELLCASWGLIRQKLLQGILPSAAEMGAIRLLLCEFGMTPASRRKVPPAAPEKKENPFACFGKKPT